MRTKAVVFAVGPFMEGGPERVTVAPSSKGGIVTTFFLPRCRDVTVAVLNNDDLLFLIGSRSALDVQRVPLLEAATHAQRLVGRV